MTEAFDWFRAARGGYDEQPGSAACEQHGPYSQTVYFDQGVEAGRRPRHCPICTEEEQRKREQEEAERKHRERVQQLLHEAELPRRFFCAGFENYDPANNRQAYKAIHAYAERWPEQCRTGESLILLGGVGTGKTHLAVALLKHVIHQEASGRYCTVRELVRDVRNTWQRHDELRTEARVLAGYANVGLLVLDEAGAQFGSESERLIVFEVINRRYENLLPTVVCGNATLEELERCLDPRTIDRLRENGGKALVFKGGSRRRAA